MLMHLVKQAIQPEKEGSSWRRSIADARAEIESKLENSPSLRRHLEGALQRVYRAAVKQALDETGVTMKVARQAIPEVCPYSLTELLEKDLGELTLRS